MTSNFQIVYYENNSKPSMNYLFTAAGKGTRFKNSGIEISKPLIKVFGKELLIWSLESFI